MVESISELRKKVQEPVRAYNDVAGHLVGDHLSIHVTRVFLALGLSPTVGTLAMLACGLSGSALIVFGGGWAVAGFALTFLYYVFDCVDGEVARYRRCERLGWGFHDFLFHLWVKSAFFVALGLYAAESTGRPWAFLFAVAALLGTLFTKALYDIAIVLVARYVILRAPHERERFVRELCEGTADDQLGVEGDLPGELVPYRVGGFLSFVRAASTNFDLSLLAFLFAAIADLYVDPFTWWNVPCDLKCLLLAFYGLVLPIDFADRWWSYVSRGGFLKDARRVMRRAHHFKLTR